MDSCGRGKDNWHAIRLSDSTCAMWPSVLVRRGQTARKKWANLPLSWNGGYHRLESCTPYPDANFYAIHPS